MPRQHKRHQGAGDGYRKPVGGWTVIVHGSQPGGGYLLNLYTRAGDTWKIRAAVHKYQAGP